MLKLTGNKYLGVCLCATSFGMGVGGFIHNEYTNLYVMIATLLVGTTLGLWKDKR